MVEHHTAAPTDVTGADTTEQTEHTAWNPIAASGLIVASTPRQGKTHAMRALLANAFAEGGDRG